MVGGRGGGGGSYYSWERNYELEICISFSWGEKREKQKRKKRVGACAFRDSSSSILGIFWPTLCGRDSHDFWFFYIPEGYKNSTFFFNAKII